MMIAITIVKDEIIEYDDRIPDSKEFAVASVQKAVKPPVREKSEVERASDTRFAEMAKRLLRSEMVKRGMNTAALAEKLAVLGVHDNEKNLANKIARGGFTAGFFLQCLAAMGCSVLRLEEPS